MINCREGLTLRAGGAARSDWKMKTGNINMKIARRIVFIGGWRIIMEARWTGEHELAANFFPWEAENTETIPNLRCLMNRHPNTI